MLVLLLLLLLFIKFVTEYCAAVMYMMFDMCNCPQFI